MYRNYFILNRLILELTPLLREAFVTSAFSQEKDRLILHLLKNNESFFLELSLNPGNPFIAYRESYSRAKKNTVEFFNQFLPQKISNVLIAEDDRIIKFQCGEGSFYFTIRGKYTNFYFISTSEELISFEKQEEKSAEMFVQEISSKKYLNYFNLPNFNAEVDIETVRKNFPILGKEITLEYKNRFGEENLMNVPECITIILTEIRDDPFSVLTESSSGSVHLAPATFSIFPFKEKEDFPSLIEAVNYFLHKKFSIEASTNKKKIIVRHIEKELAKVTQRINSVKIRIEKGNREVEYNMIGNLLLINLYKIEHAVSAIEVENIYDENKIITIKLDPKLSSIKNVDVYFDKSKNERISFTKAKEMYSKLKLEFDRLKEYESLAASAETAEDYNKLIKELRIKMEYSINEKEDLKSKFKQYLIDGKYNVFVGKDSKNNDLLTTRFAKQNDYWFHARSVSGSHVVLRIENTKEPVPKIVLRKTAALAAYHSKAKTAGMVPVSYAFKKYVVKKKGMEAGKVAMLKEEVLIVKPEIPNGCEYVSNE